MTRVASSANPEHVDSVISAAQKRIGTTLRGKWHLERLLGVGGMAAVYAGRHRNGMLGAVKVLDAELSRNSECRERFLREGRIANEVRHGGAVRVLDDDETSDGSAFLVMELLTGSTLEELASERGGKLAPVDVARYTAQVLATLAVAHAAKIVHRDIKPENLFVTKEQIVKLVDFGIARMAGVGDKRLTQSGEMMGTPAFMSPEQARGRIELIDGRSDLYALGATMYTLLTGKIVHDKAHTVPELLVLAVTEPAPRLTDPDVPAELAAVVDRALSFDKKDRYADASEMLAALGAAYQSMTGEALPTITHADAETTISQVSSTRVKARFATTMVPLRKRVRVLAVAGPLVLALALLGASARLPAASRAAPVVKRSLETSPSAQLLRATAVRPDPSVRAAVAPPTASVGSVAATATSIAAPTTSAPTATAMIDAQRPTSRRSAVFDRRN